LQLQAVSKQFRGNASQITILMALRD